MKNLYNFPTINWCVDKHKGSLAGRIIILLGKWTFSSQNSTSRIPHAIPWTNQAWTYEQERTFSFLKQHYISIIHSTTTQYIHFSSFFSHTSIFRLSSFHMIKIFCIGYNIYSILFDDSHFPSAYDTTIISYKHVLPWALTSTIW